MQTAVAHVHPRLESLPLSLLELILCAAFPASSSGPEDVGYAARGLLHVACTHRDLRAAAVDMVISKFLHARSYMRGWGADIPQLAILPPFLRLFAIDYCRQPVSEQIPRPNWYQDVEDVWRDMNADAGGWYQDTWGVWHTVEEEVAAVEVMRTNREGIAQFEQPCLCCHTKVHGIPKELPATVAGFATAPVLFALLQRSGRYGSYCVHVHVHANQERGPRCFEHDDMRLRLQPVQGGGVEPKSVGKITLYSDVPVWYGQDEATGGHQPTSLWIDVTQSKLGEKLLHEVQTCADDPEVPRPEQRWPELELKLLCPGVIITCDHESDDGGDHQDLVFRTAPGDLYLKGGGNFSNWLLRFFPDEEESDEASLNGGESLREEEDDGESGEREDEDEDEHAVGEEEGEHEVAEEEEAS